MIGMAAFVGSLLMLNSKFKKTELAFCEENVEPAPEEK